MEVTTAERYASGGPGKGQYAQNLPLAFRRRPSTASATIPRSSGSRATSSESISWNEVATRRTADRRRPREARHRQGRHRRDDAQQPPGVHPDATSAAVSLGAVPFSIYQTSSPEQIQYVVADAGAQGR